jgi:hypothetical protein
MMGQSTLTLNEVGREYVLKQFYEPYVEKPSQISRHEVQLFEMVRHFPCNNRMNPKS